MEGNDFDKREDACDGTGEGKAGNGTLRRRRTKQDRKPSILRQKSSLFILF